MRKYFIFLGLLFTSNNNVIPAQGHRYLLSGDRWKDPWLNDDASHYNDHESIELGEFLSEQPHEAELVKYLQFIFDGTKTNEPPEIIDIGDTIFIGNKCEYSFEFKIVQLFTIGIQTAGLPALSQLTKGSDFTPYERFIIMTYAEHKTKNSLYTSGHLHDDPLSMELFGVAFPYIHESDVSAFALISFDEYSFSKSTKRIYKFQALINFHPQMEYRYPLSADKIIPNAIRLIPGDRRTLPPMAISDYIAISNESDDRR